jgi:hypothetical protein
MSTARPNPLRLFSHMLAALFNSRSAFQEQCRRYGALAERSGGVTGRWSGEWISERSGHHGELRCVLDPSSATEYRAYFHAKFSKLFRVGYVTTLKAEETGGHVSLRGEEDLGSLAGGIYRCEGEATTTAFNCRYSCKYDQGVFRLARLD